MNHCKDCKHKREYRWTDTLTSICDRIPHAAEYDPTKDKAFVQDAEDYGASLRVTEKFGCVLWEAKS